MTQSLFFHSGNTVNIEKPHFIVLLVGLFIGAASIPGVILSIVIIILVQKLRRSTTKCEPHYEDINNTALTIITQL